MTRRPTRRRAVRWMVLAALAAVPLASAPQASATFPGQNGRIAFWDFNTRQIYTVNPNGTGPAQLTHTDSTHATTDPSWSPNGRFIIFTRLIVGTPDDHARIWIMRRDGSQAHQLSHDLPGYRNYTGSFTPDGRHIVFARCKPNDGVCAIWSMNSDGTHMHALTLFREGRNEAVDFDPVVSADGELAFTRFFWRGITSQVYVSRHGETPRAVTPVALEGFAADWSPSGGTFDFTSNSLHFQSTLFTISATGTGLDRLMPAPPYPNSNFRSAFSPDGSRIAFLTDRGHPDLCCVELWGARADGTGRHRIQTGPLTGVFNPSWGPAVQGSGVSLAPARADPAPAGRPVKLPALCHATGGDAPYC
jgi:Tol biopolymer transport system component